MRRKRKAQSNDVSPDLPITPMLDMAFQLLAFFVMTFNPTPVEGHLDMALPKIEGGESSTPPPASLDDEAEELVITVEANAAGEISDIKLGAKQDTASNSLQDPAKKDFDIVLELRNVLKARLKEKNNKAPKVKLQMAENLSYKLVVMLMDEISRAGYKQVAPALLTAGAPKK